MVCKPFLSTEAGQLRFPQGFEVSQGCLRKICHVPLPTCSLQKGVPKTIVYVPTFETITICTPFIIPLILISRSRRVYPSNISYQVRSMHDDISLSMHMYMHLLRESFFAVCWLDNLLLRAVCLLIPEPYFLKTADLSGLLFVRILPRQASNLLLMSSNTSVGNTSLLVIHTIHVNTLVKQRVYNDPGACAAQVLW